MPRLNGEGPEEWRARVASAHADAIEKREHLWVQEGHDRPTAEGSEFAATSDEYDRVDDLVKVLEWQLTQIPTSG